MICLGALPTVVAFLNPGRGSDGRPWSSSAASSTATVLMRFMDFRCARRDSCCSFSSKLPLLKEARKLKKYFKLSRTILGTGLASGGRREHAAADTPLQAGPSRAQSSRSSRSRMGGHIVRRVRRTREGAAFLPPLRTGPSFAATVARSSGYDPPDSLTKMRAMRWRKFGTAGGGAIIDRTLKIGF